FTPDTNNSYLSEAIAEDLTTLLAQVHGLKVPGRTSTQLSYKNNNKNVVQIGQQLGVSWVLEGSIHEAGENKIRVNAQLINAGNHRHVWARFFDRSSSQLSSVPFDLARGILEALRVKIPPTLLASQKQPDPEAYRMFLRGRQQLNLRTEAGLHKARELFDQ